MTCPMKYQDLLGKRLLAIDYGKKRTGTALYHVGQDPFPTPYLQITLSKDGELIKSLLKIIDNECIDHIVLGLPTYLTGEHSKMSQLVLKFRDSLQLHFQGHIFLQDESLTSHEAESRMKEDPRYQFKVNKAALDSLSAVIILEDFIAQLQRSEKA